MTKVRQGDVILQRSNYEIGDDIQCEVSYVINDPIHKTGKILAILRSDFDFQDEYPMFNWQTTISINRELVNKSAIILFHWEI